MPRPPPLPRPRSRSAASPTHSRPEPATTRAAVTIDLPAGSPEAAYADFVFAARRGDSAAALAKVADVPDELRVACLGMLDYVAAVEDVKEAMRARFGDEAVELEPMGLPSDAVLASLQSTTDGDRATLTAIAPVTEQRESLQFEAVRRGGEWRIPGEAFGFAPDPAEAGDQPSPAQFALLVDSARQVEREVREGKYEQEEVASALLYGLMRSLAPADAPKP